MLEYFDKYWDIEKVNLLQVVAIVLDPQFKLKYVEYMWRRMFD